MFASLLAYQLIDLLFAAALIAAAGLLARRLPGHWVATLARRFPRALATPFRRLALLALPAFVLLMVATAFAWRSFVAHGFNDWAKGHPELQRAANVGVFLFLGATFVGVLVLFPLLGLARAWREPQVAQRRRDRRLAVAACAAAAALLAYTVVFEPGRIVVEERVIALPTVVAGRVVALPDAPAEPGKELRIVLLSDLQSGWLGARERRVPGIVASLRPDLILVAGDLVAQSFDEALPLAMARFVLSGLSGLGAPLGVFVVNGDVDDVVAGGIVRVIEGTGARLLDNESVLLATDPPIELAGFDPRGEARAAELLGAPAKAQLRIALTHRPRHYAELGDAGYQLVLAGHTHGGQVVIPGFGPPVTYETVARAVAAGGLHVMENGVQLYVTRGLGLEGGFAPPIRFHCPPEITLLRIASVACSRSSRD